MNSLRYLVALAAIAVPALPGIAQATWLDLPDGNYQLTLNCTVSSVIACPSSISGTATVSGSGLSAMDFTVNGQLFSGDPVDGVFTNSLADYQYSLITLSPFSFLSIRNNLSLQFGPDDHWWVYCHNTGVDTCSPGTSGNWVATPLNEAPEPITIGLLGLGLALLAFTRRFDF